MLKMYQAQVSSGSTAEFWDHTWAESELARVLADERIVENDPSYDLLMDKVRADGLFLEGGCGQGQWVKYLANRGYRAVGVDFAERTIERLRRAAPELDVRVANIVTLPFADGEVQSYYSNGVVEHIESGPEPALREARRVIQRDGWFLCAVPDASSLRRRLFRRERTERSDLDPPLTVTQVDSTAEQSPPPGMEFFQYAFTTREFTRLLEDAGFVVDRTFGYGFVWGLMEMPHFRAAYDRAVAAARAVRDRVQGSPPPPPEEPVEAPATPPLARAGEAAGGVGGFLRRALVKEDRHTPLVGPLIDVLCEHCSSMRMFVARPRP